MKLAALVLLAGSLAHADVTAYNNLGPGDSYSGNGWIVYGPLTSPPWTHAFQFTAAASGPITRILVPIQHLSGGSQFRFELYSDTGSTPDASLGIIGIATGFDNSSPPLPPPVELPAANTIPITSGTTYWLVAFGVGDVQGTWHANNQSITGLRAYRFSDPPWTTGTVEIGAFRIEVAGGDEACYANCDQSTAAPILNANDFQCFLNTYAAGDSAANCDGSTANPILNANDFQCFLNKFAAGCS